jgi:hypothetical protein
MELDEELVGLTGPTKKKPVEKTSRKEGGREGIPEGVLEGQLASGKPLDGGAESGRIDEGEHVVQPLVLGADQVAARRDVINTAGVSALS